MWQFLNNIWGTSVTGDLWIRGTLTTFCGSECVWCVKVNLTIDLLYIRPDLTSLDRKVFGISAPLYFSRVTQALYTGLQRLCSVTCNNKGNCAKQIYIRPDLTSLGINVRGISDPLYLFRVAQAMCTRFHRLCGLGCTSYVQRIVMIKLSQPSLSGGLAWQYVFWGVVEN